VDATAPYGACKVIEDSKSALVWAPGQGTLVNYRDLGPYEITKICEMVLISELGVGGTVVTKAAGTYLLDNGYLIEGNGTDPRNLTDLWANANEYVDNTKSGVQRDIMEATHLGRIILAQKYFNIGISQKVCQLQQQFDEMKEFVLGGLFLYPRKGYRFVRQGAALLANKCKRISNYTIQWSRKVRGRCFAELPVQATGSTLRFLNPLTMKLTNDSQTLNCSQVTHEKYFVTNSAGDTYQVEVQQGNPRFVKQQLLQRSATHRLPKLAMYNSRLIHTLPREIDRTMAMEAIDDLADTVNALNAEYIEAGVDSMAELVNNGVKDGVNEVKEWGQGIGEETADWITSRILHMSVTALHWVITWILVIVVYRRRPGRRARRQAPGKPPRGASAQCVIYTGSSKDLPPLGPEERDTLV
jgi:hypothetical protein